jgi:hypothetical protein
MFLHINSEFAHLNHRQLNNQLILLFPAIKSCRNPGTTAETTKAVRASVVVVVVVMAAMVMAAVVAEVGGGMSALLLLLVPVHNQ